jgi:hypothetical protein
MEISLAKTLARKHQISVAKVYKKYQAKLDIQGKSYKGLQVTVPREGKKPLVATWGGIPLIWDRCHPDFCVKRNNSKQTSRERKPMPLLDRTRQNRDSSTHL